LRGRLSTIKEEIQDKDKPTNDSIIIESQKALENSKETNKEITKINFKPNVKFEDNLNNLKCIGQFLYTYYSVHFVLAGFLLLLGIIV